MRWVVLIWCLVLWKGLSFAELPSLEELKRSALENNLGLKTKKEELKAIEAQESIFNQMRLGSNYNFETQTSFVGITFSLPFDFFGQRGKYLKYKRAGLEEARQILLFELEDLYLKYQGKSKDMAVYEANLKEKELKYCISKVGFKHQRVGQEELFRQEKEFKQAEAELSKAKEELKAMEERLYALAGARKGS